jgi:hypothetical protein
MVKKITDLKGLLEISDFEHPSHGDEQIFNFSPKIGHKKNAKAPQRFLILNTLPVEINKF